MPSRKESVAITPSVLRLQYGSDFQPVCNLHVDTNTRLLHDPVEVETWDLEKDKRIIEWLQQQYPQIKVVRSIGQRRGWNRRHIPLPKETYESNVFSEILPGLFLSGLFCSHVMNGSKAVPKSLHPLADGTTHIIHIFDSDDPCSGKIFDHDLEFNLSEKKDEACAQIMSVLPTCVRYIHDVRKDPKNKVLVHCYAGKNRSVTIVAAYLLLAGYCVHADEALHFIRTRHPNASPMDDFVELLEQIAALQPMLSKLIF